MTHASTFRVVKFAFQNFIRNIWLSAATVSVLALTLVSVNALVILNVLGKVALSTVESRIDVSVHFKPEVEESRVQTAKIALLGLPEVKDVVYISPAESLRRFSEMNEAESSVVAALGEIDRNPFGATLVITSKKLEDYSAILAALDAPFYTDLIEGRNFDDRQAMIARIESVSRKVDIGLVTVSALFGAIAALIVFNTIRVSIYTHREEIGIMRLVGASDGFIRGPFYAESVLWTVIALIVTFGFLYPMLGAAQPFLQRFFGTGSVDLIGFYSANFVRVIGLQFVAAAGLAVATTKIATMRYLKI